MTKKIAIASLGILFVCGAFSFADDILDKLGVRDPRYQVLNNMVNTYISPTCVSGCQYFSIPRPAKLADVLTGDKKSLARDACVWLKEYVESGEFHAAYQKRRLNDKPHENEAVTPNPETIASYKEVLENAKASLKSARTADEKEVWRKMIPQSEYMLEQAKQEYPMTWAWEQKYPASTDSAVARALRYYLAESATVDFNAALTSRGKVRIFANPVYEKKSAMWKAIYRAGKEVNDETRLFVTNWLKQGVHVSTEGYIPPSDKKEDVKSATPVLSSSAEQPEDKTEKADKGTKKAGGLFKKIKKVLD